ncbi:hypothetical protein ACFL96_16525 [Thermoproteota archaeon]
MVDFVTSGTELPLRIILTITTLVQVNMYVLVIFYSLFIGGIDLVLPVKSSIILTIGILLFLAFGDVWTNWRNRDSNLSELGISIYRLVAEFGTSAGLFVLSYLFLLEPVSNVDLTGLSFDLKIVAVLGLLTSIAFSATSILELFRFKRKGMVPKANVEIR